MTKKAVGNQRLGWIVVVVAMIWPTVMAWYYFQHLQADRGTVGRLQQMAYSFAKLVQFALPILWLWLVERRLSALKRPNFRGWGIGVAFGLLVAIGMVGLYYGGMRGSPLLDRAASELRGKLNQFGVLNPMAFGLLALFIIVPHSLLEEYYYRWFIFGRLRSAMAFWLAILLSSLAFMAHHVIILDQYLPGYFWTSVIPFSLGIAVGGAVWAWLYDRTGSIYPSWLSHAIVDAALFVIGWDMLWGR